MNKEPRILLVDIETSPNLGYVWGKWEQNVIAVKEYGHIISVAYKWLDEKLTYGVGLNGFKGYTKDKSNDKQLVNRIWELLDEADIVVSHNGKAFDIKKINARFAYHNIKPPSPYKQVDTKLAAKLNFNFTSNSLDDLCDYLKIGRKIQTGGFDLWLGCMAGDKKSWESMIQYNRNDVILLEKIYLRLLPFMQNHPNLGTILQDKVCPKCGSVKLQSRGVSGTQTAIYRNAQCQKCFGWCRFPEKERAIKILRNI